jgi:putative flippase GtrA
MTNKLTSFLKFCAVGLLNTGIDFLVFTILTFFNMQYLEAQCISYGCGVVNSYIINRIWTFQRREKANRLEFFKFITVNILTLVITSCLLSFLYQHIGWPMLLSKLCATAVGVIVNFIGTRIWVFTDHN